MGRFALISVSDKTGLVAFANRLIQQDFQILSTGGTRQTLEEANIAVLSVSDFTKFPEILDGRVKTLHPAVFAGLLADLDNEEHRRTLKELSLTPIELVAVNLYPFEKTISRTSKVDEIVENIDIGGPSLLRAAAKNGQRVTAVCDPNDYEKAIQALDSKELRLQLAAKVFRHTSEYDRVIADHFLAPPKAEALRYGENPHQRGWLSKLPDDIEILHGKALSYNNILDASSAIDLAGEFENPFVAILKHENPCGCAISEDVKTAFEKAHSGDPTSAFGGIVISNRKINKEVALELNKHFFEIVIAPDFSDDAIDCLKKKKNRRIVRTRGSSTNAIQIRTTRVGRLYQDSDPPIELTPKDCKLASKKEPTTKQWEDLIFAWKVAKHVKSNAIVLAKDCTVVGVGAGQMSRIDALDLAIKKAGDKADDSVMASDAFFPFSDGPAHAANAGIAAIIQPGGSKRDQEVIDVCDEKDIAMAFTGKRHFRH